MFCSIEFCERKSSNNEENLCKFHKKFKDNPELQCQKITKNNNQCFFQCSSNSIYCTKHVSSISSIKCDSSTNTEQSDINDLDLANSIIFELIQQNVELNSILSQIDLLTQN